VPVFRHIPSVHLPLHRLVLRACGLALLLACCLGAGCASEPGINWEERYAVYTYADAVRDYGEPAACAGEPEGGRVCSWKVGGAFQYRDQMVMKFDAADRLESFRTAKIR